MDLNNGNAQDLNKKLQETNAPNCYNNEKQASTSLEDEALIQSLDQLYSETYSEKKGCR